jgi:hypothetical protein
MMRSVTVPTANLNTAKDTVGIMRRLIAGRAILTASTDSERETISVMDAGT